jgi:V/A-type H+/Na+-transporting ATPase subunit I
MSWRDSLQPVRMQRMALVAPAETLRAVLARVADAGVMELDHPGGDPTAAEPSAGSGAVDAELNARCGDAVRRDSVAALAGWVPASASAELAARLADLGGALVPLRPPRGVDVPSLLRRGRLRGSLAPLVETYGSVPYADVDPTPLAAAAYLLMFGMMFGDVGHGALLVLAAVALRFGRSRRLTRLRAAWPLVAGAGLASIAFGFLYGECFGPTGLVPVLWLEPLEQPIPLLAAAIGLGGLLLAGAYVLGTVNRWREGGLAAALYAPSGFAGAALFAGAGLVGLGWYLHQPWLTGLGGAAAALGLALAFVGLLAEAGGQVLPAAMQLFEVVIGLGSNVASFARLAAFGLTHAALGSIVWGASTGLWQRGGGAMAGAVLVFAVGNAVSFALEALVAAVQALRLEYYELFSRVFLIQGRPFRPWHLPSTSEPTASEEALPCTPGSPASR